MPTDLTLLFKRIDALLSADSGLKLAQVARMLYVERHAIEKAVSQLTSRTFREYRQEKKKEQALGLLTGSDLAMKEIAARLGYSWPQGVSRFVKAVTGKTPRSIRADAIARKMAAISD